VAVGGYASVNGLEQYCEVYGEGADFLPKQCPEMLIAIGDLLGVRSRP